LEDRARTGPVRAVVEIDDLRIEQKELTHGGQYVVRRPPYRDTTMHEGTWTVRPCPHGVQSQLAATLGVSELTAGVLVRRGFTDPDAARAFLEGERPPHDPFLLGDMHLACERI